MNPNLPSGLSKLRSFSALARPGTVSLGLGKPYEDMPAVLRDLAADVVGNAALPMDYSANDGHSGVRALLEQHYELPPGSTLLTHGAQEALFACLLALLRAGDEVLVPNPGFLAYAPLVKMLGGKPVLYALARDGANFSYDLAAIRRKVSRRTRAIFLNAPANPTGSTASVEFVRELAEEFPRVRVLSDEVYAELDYEEPYIPLARYGKNIVSVNAFSKSHALTGWRIGWLATTDAKLRGALLVAHQYLVTCASVPAQHLIGALLSEGKLFASVRDHYCQEYLLRRDLFFRHAGEAVAGLLPPRAGFYAFVPIPRRQRSSLAFAEKLLEKKNVLVIPGEFFGSAGKRHVRVSYSASPEDLRIAAAAMAEFY